jgi:putative Mg2+ transporter-C (MgtC) family protein
MAPFDWQSQLIEVGKLAAAYALIFPVGWFREKEAHTIGVRTFPLVAVASCGYVLLAGPGIDAQSRVIQGLVTGIGFLGGAAIFRSEQGVVHGAATAASIWATAAVGAAVAQEQWLLAAGMALFDLFVLRVLKPLKEKLDTGSRPEDRPK